MTTNSNKAGTRGLMGWFNTAMDSFWRRLLPSIAPRR
jgi:hypothetical protein